MRQNVYDNPAFFGKYKAYRRSDVSLNKRVEQPAIKALLPSLHDLNVLDLGCGFGGLCAHAIFAGARRVVGVDCSVNMCREANARHSYMQFDVIHQFVEDIDLGDQFDVVISSLMLHYVNDIDIVFRKISKWCAPKGRLILSINHPMYSGALARSNDSVELRYVDEGPREHVWFGERVIKYHRTLQTYLAHLNTVGFRVDVIRELSIPAEFSEQIPSGVLRSNHGPIFLLLSAQRITTV